MFMRPLLRHNLRQPYDSFKSQVAVAYSTRRMFSTYTGPLIRIRRSSDNTEQDISYGAGGNLDTTSLSSFLGASNGFVVTWYDQSGNNRHVTQATTTKQPQISTTGMGGRPGLQFTASSSQELVYTGAGLTTSSPHTLFVVGKMTAWGVFGGFAGYGGASDKGSTIGTTSANPGIWWAGGRFNTTQTGQTADQNPHVFTKQVSSLSGVNTNLYVDGARNILNATTNSYTIATGNFVVGASSPGSSFINGMVSEVMLFMNITVNRQELEAIANRWIGSYDPLMYPTSTVSNYHVFLVAGQSNALGLGYGIDYNIETADPLILQWACGGVFFNTAMIGRDPLHAPDTTNQNINGSGAPGVGFATAFARAYRTGQNLDNNTGVILVNAAYGGTGFSNSKWGVGQTQYSNAVTQVNNCLSNGPGTTRTIKGILWHQGEVDVTANYSSSTYQTNLLAVIDGLRGDITGASSTTPFIVGQMVPEWIASQNNGSAINSIHAAIPSLRTSTAFWSGATNGYNSNAISGGNIHYSAYGQRINGASAYAAYVAALLNV